GTLDAGLNRNQPGTGAVAVFRAGAAEDTLASDRVDAVIEDRHGTTWVGTYAGLHAIPPTRQGVIRTWKDPAVAGLLGGQITALHEAADGTLWVGTGGRGVVRVDIGAEGRPVTATPLRRREGLPNDNVFAIRSDAQGSVWFNTGDGLARFDPASGRIVAFGVADGVQGKEFREAAFFEPATGRLFVGGTNGFSVFEPAAVEAAAPPPPVMLTAFSVLNRPVPIGPGSPLPVRITDAATVTLRPGASVFSIEFAAADFTDPQRVRYAYQLEGFDAEWNETDASRRFATYTNLSPGRYTFRVRAANRDGEWNPEPRELAVIILPPFWMTWWFRTLAVMAIAALVLTVHRMRLRGVEAQRARLAREVIARTRELEEEKARALTAQTMAEQANDAKSAFLAGVSHELRTPLNAIVGLADVLGDSETGPRQQQYIAALRSSGQALSELIDDILDLSKIEAGRFELVATPFDVRALVEESVDLVRLAAEQKGLRVTVALAANVPAVVEGDARALRRILFNLLSNAVKFTAAGSVSVDVASRSDGTLLFIVADTGIGIAPEHQERIFATFTQAEPGIAQEYGGTGLGLALTRQLAHLMAGRIWVDSQVGVGTTFVVALPLPAASAAPAAAAQSRPGDGLRVLAVDDAAMNRLVLEAYFQGTPHTLVLADNGTAALAMFRESRFDVVLMDVNMPGMDGYATIREMRAWESAEHRPRTPIVAFTAHAFADDVERSRVAGCDGHLAKPLRREALMAALAHQAAGGAPAPTVQVDADLAGYLPDYLTATRAQLAAALADLDAGRRDPLRTLGHNLKGSGGSFGLPGISRLGMELEDAAVRGSESQLREGARRLGEYLAEVRVTFGGEHI
ncbi:MAG: ATP-binding protein, partial [Vicinamibacterales bacterium]